MDKQHTTKIKLFILLNWLCTSSLSVGLDNGIYQYSSEEWDGLCKTGTKQSPINLLRKSHTPDRSVPLNFNKFYYNDEFWTENTGHTIRVTFKPETTSLAKMYDFEFPCPYIFAEIHFHWGLNDSSGSEHAINNRFYAMEAHLVHFKAKYKNFKAAVESDDPKAVAVIGVFIASGSESDCNSGFETIAANIPHSSESVNSTHIVQSIDLTTFLPKMGQRFFRYYGSLTTPNCNEVVVWTVIEKPIYVQPSLIQKFRNVMESPNKLIGENYRPLQKRGNRMVQYLAKK